MIVVADTSVLLNICRIGKVELLIELFREIIIPPEVAGGRSFIRSAYVLGFHVVEAG